VAGDGETRKLKAESKMGRRKGAGVEEERKYLLKQRPRMPCHCPKEGSDATLNRACSRGGKQTKRLDNNKNGSLYLLGAWERMSCKCGCCGAVSWC
jgi:hypothetical protein